MMGSVSGLVVVRVEGLKNTRRERKRRELLVHLAPTGTDWRWMGARCRWAVR